MKLGAVSWCGGYHSGTNIGGTAVSYAVVADCTEPPSDAAFAGLDLAASHEVVEAATDPCFAAGCTGFQLDFDHYAWEFLQMLYSIGPITEANAGGEVGDLCFSETDGFTVPGTLYDVQRIWSNAAMRAGHDPCVPRTTTAPYFNAMPVLSDDIDFAVGAETTVSTKGVSVPVGQSRTVELDLYSDGDTGGPFKVSPYAIDLAGRQCVHVRVRPVIPSIEARSDRGPEWRKAVYSQSPAPGPRRSGQSSSSSRFSAPGARTGPSPYRSDGVRSATGHPERRHRLGDDGRRVPVSALPGQERV